MDISSVYTDTKNTDKAIGVMKRFEVAKNKRVQFLDIWQEVADLVLPNRGGFYNIGDNYSIVPYDTHCNKYDDTATNALVKAASAFYSYTANPATQWFGFSILSVTNNKNKQFSVDHLLRQRDIRQWLDKASEITARYINSNAQAGWHALAQEVLAFSTSALFVIEDPSDAVVNIQPVALKDLYVLNSINGGIGEVYRTIMLTNEQVLMQFGQKDSFLMRYVMSQNRIR